MSSPHTGISGDRYRFTAREVLAMIDGGLLEDAEDYELLDGELIHVTAKGPLHRVIASALEKRLDRTLPPGFHAQKEECVAGDARSLPEPDVAIVRGRLGDYRDRLPEGKDLLLAIEVSVSTLDRDRRKRAIYARAGVPELWILDVERRRLERYMEARGARYAAKAILEEADEVEVPGVGQRWTVASMLDES